MPRRLRPDSLVRRGLWNSDPVDGLQGPGSTAELLQDSQREATVALVDAVDDLIDETKSTGKWLIALTILLVVLTLGLVALTAVLLIKPPM